MDVLVSLLPSLRISIAIAIGRCLLEHSGKVGTGFPQKMRPHQKLPDRFPLLLSGKRSGAAPGKNQVLWLIVSFIPLFNIGFVWYVFQAVAARILDRLDAVSRRVGVQDA